MKNWYIAYNESLLQLLMSCERLSGKFFHILSTTFLHLKLLNRNAIKLNVISDYGYVLIREEFKDWKHMRRPHDVFTKKVYCDGKTNGYIIYSLSY